MNEQQNTRDKARLKSWEGGEYIAVNNVRETACDTAHWGWVRGFNEGFKAGAASVDRRAIVDLLRGWLDWFNGPYTEGCDYINPPLTKTNAVLAEMGGEE